jgi:hypothetical protein
VLPQVPKSRKALLIEPKGSGLAERTRSSRRELRAWESGDRDWVLESEMSVAKVGERHLACDTKVGREAHQGGAG